MYAHTHESPALEDPAVQIPQDPSPVTSKGTVPQREIVQQEGGPQPPPAVKGDTVEVTAAAPRGVCPFGFGAAASAPTQHDEAPHPTPAKAHVETAPPPVVLESPHGQGQQPIPASDWHDPAPTSPEKRQAFVDQVSGLQSRLLEAGKVTEISRGFHQKQNWGGKATISFDANMPEGLRKEAFANVAGHNFTAAVRFSNGQGCPHKDSKADVRGMAMKMNIGGQEVDLLATNHITFARDADQFMKFAEIAGTMQADGNLHAIYELVEKIHDGEYSAKETARIAARLVSDTARHTRHVGAETYWTQAVKVGDMTGRFAFTPESGADAKRGWFPHENYLRDGMEHDLEQHDVKMKITFEAFTDDAVAHDASVHGDHITFPVGEITFEKRAKGTAARDLEEQVVSNMSFNPSHGLRMAGTMNESNRAAIYEASAKNRHATSWDAPEVQAFFGQGQPPPAAQ